MICIKFVLLHRRKAPPSVSSKCIEAYIKLSLKISGNVLNRKCTEPERQRMSNDLMELNGTELNYIYFEADSDDVSNKSDEDFVV